MGYCRKVISKRLQVNFLEKSQKKSTNNLVLCSNNQDRPETPSGLFSPQSITSKNRWISSSILNVILSTFLGLIIHLLSVFFFYLFIILTIKVFVCSLALFFYYKYHVLFKKSEFGDIFLQSPLINFIQFYPQNAKKLRNRELRSENRDFPLVVSNQFLIFAVEKGAKTKEYDILRVNEHIPRNSFTAFGYKRRRQVHRNIRFLLLSLSELYFCGWYSLLFTIQEDCIRKVSIVLSQYIYNRYLCAVIKGTYFLWQVKK